MLEAIIIDDEPNAIRALELELSNFGSRIKIAGKFLNPSEALTFLKEKEVDVVFLDMEMPEMTGLQFLENFNERDFHVVFTTAYSKYALNAIKTEALDYLVKPVDTQDLENALTRLEKAVKKESFDERLEEALDRLNGMSSAPRKIKLVFDGKIAFYGPDEISYLEAMGNYTQVYLTDNSKILLTKKLKQIEYELPEVLFYRIHKSYVINLSKIKMYKKNAGIIVLDSNVELPVSEQKREIILNRL